MENLNDIVFYTIDKSIKSYKQFAQKRLKDAGFTITVDQWLVLKAIEENEHISQQQIAERVFKDVASITRIIELLVKKGYLERSFHSTDRRRFELKLTTEAKGVLKKMQPYIESNRSTALDGISAEELSTLRKTLNKLIKNVT
jgi:MarR family transcriptional regulator for hemolysin